MILYLVRHGIAVDRTDPKCPPDPERPLTARGVQKTRLAALGLKELGAKPDAILTSPYVRAAQTAEIFAEALGFPLEKIRVSEFLKPGDNPAETLREISRIRAKEVACFGHAPHLDMMIAYLTGARTAFTELKKAGAACLEQASAQGRWELRWLAVPKILREVGD
ncbi:MAG TPA: phosphohistidine phosphatase SixA [Candidatus Dormibacteraeota bacterium]|nr:phosphohistidine phosphatase SixA [Candidatus Dormibacteraeota bacterium]